MKKQCALKTLFYRFIYFFAFYLKCDLFRMYQLTIIENLMDLDSVAFCFSFPLFYYYFLNDSVCLSFFLLLHTYDKAVDDRFMSHPPSSAFKWHQMWLCPLSILNHNLNFHFCWIKFKPYIQFAKTLFLFSTK